MGRIALAFVSGKILALDGGHRVITLEEVGPGTGRPAGLVTRRIELTSATRIELVSRARAAAAGGWAGGFKQAPQTATHLRVGDYVTVTIESRPGHGRAVSVTVMRPETAVPAAAGQQAGLFGQGR